MKCKWYDDFEGVCTNDACPYRGDVCPTSEHMEACKYYEQAKKKLSVEELVEGLRTCGKANLCHGCPAYSIPEEKCATALKEQAADMLEKLAAEKEAKKPEWISVKDRLPGAGTCTKCGWDSPVGIDSESAFRMAMRRAEPKNRVLTLEELKAYCEGGADAAPLWYEVKDHSNVNRWMVIDLPELAFGSAATVKCLVNSQFFEPTYGEDWRCWLRKPTEAERRGTPWES